VYHCLYYGVRSPTEYDVVVVDEVQDLNDANHAFLRRCVAPESRHTVVCAVGDPAQAIYQFRGANPRSLCKFRDVFAAESLSLTCCFRCPRRVVAVAAYLNRDISAAPGAELGTVRVHTAARHWVADLLRLAECAPPGEVTLFTTRCNATVIDILLYLHTLSPGCGLSIRWAAPTVASQLREVLEWPGHFTLQSLHDTAADPTTGDHAPVDRAVLRLLATAIQTEGPDSDAATSPFLAHALRALCPAPGTTAHLVLATIHSAKGAEYDHVVVHRSSVAHYTGWVCLRAPNTICSGPTTRTGIRNATCCTLPLHVLCAVTPGVRRVPPYKVRAIRSLTFLLTEHTRHVPSTLLPLELIRHVGEL
jgi:hypothetical protein